MIAASTHLPPGETALRQARCRERLGATAPEAEGLLVFSRLNIYYLTGAYAPGVFWLPREGRSLLLVRKGLERAQLEASGTDLASYRSFGDLPGLLAGPSRAMPKIVAAETGGLPWSLGTSLAKALAETRTVPGDRVLQEARSVKTPWELETTRRCGFLHRKAVCEILPERIRPGMTEFEISRLAWDVMFSLGHLGPMRMAAFGEEAFLGHVATGDSANHPSWFNGPLGLKGAHPAGPFMGSPAAVWEKNSLLALDIGFCLEGYNTDKTHLYFAGKPADFPDQARRAQDCCLEIEALVAEALRPGAVPAEIYAQSVALAEKRGFAAGYMGFGNNQVPFLGHGIGLCVDERPVLAKGFGEPLRPGMILAVEPKIGLPGFGMAGTENTWEVTDNAPLCLTGPDPMTFVG